MKTMRHLSILILMAGFAGLSSQAVIAQSNDNTASLVTTNGIAPPRLEVRNGLRMELVADATLVESPAAMAFDELGRLFVTELRDYPTRPAETTLSGRVRLLEDNDGDGVFDTSVVFADNLERPSGIACSRGGVFVAGPAGLAFLLDQDGDGIADLQRTLLRFNTPDGSEKPDQFIRNMTWGPDRRIYVGFAPEVGSVLNANASSEGVLRLSGGGFSFDPLTLQLRPESGSGVTSHSFGGTGRHFVCQSSDALAVTMLNATDAGRNPYLPNQPTTAMLVSAREQGNPLTCLIYRGNKYPTNLQGQAFLANPTANALDLVQLQSGRTHPTAAAHKGRHLQPLVTGPGSSFRPMHLAVGPDDLLYIADLSRQTYPGNESSNTNPPTAHGRIWRLVPPEQPSKAENPAAFSDEVDLVSALGSPNAWVRGTAARLLAEGRATNSINSLRRVLAYSKTPLARLEALRSLEAAGAAATRDLAMGMGDKDPSLRATAVAMAARRAAGGRIPHGLWAALRTRSADPSAEVRLNTALALGSLQAPAPGVLLANLYVRDSADIWMSRAMLTTRPESLALLFTELIREPSVRRSPNSRDLLLGLATSIGLGGNFNEVSGCLGTLRDLDAPVDIAFPIIIALADGLEGRGLRLSDVDEAGHWLAIANTAQSFAVKGTDIRTRSDAVRVMGACVGPDFVADEYLLLMFASGLPVPMQIPVIEALARQGLDRDFEALTQRWHLWDVPEQLATLNALLHSRDGTEALLTALSDDTIPIEGLTSVHINLLREYPADNIKARAVRLLGATQPNRDELMAHFVGALDLHGSTSAGRQLFNQRCSYCHRSGSESFGPSLAEMHSMSPLQFVAGVIDPSREMASDHRTTILKLANDRMAWGTTSGDMDSILELTTPEGTQPYVRGAVGTISYPEWSLMPDNVSAGLTRQDVSDLVTFIRHSAVVR